MITKPATDTSDENQARTGPLVEWADQYLTGLEDIDEQHQRLVAIINELDALQLNKSSPEKLVPVYEKLRNYTLYHFSHEEELMNTWPINSANKATHFKAHKGFVERIARIDKLIEYYPVHVIDNLLAFLVKWLLNHIATIDTHMAREIIALQQGDVVREEIPSAGTPQKNMLTDLYDDMELRSLDILELNVQLQNEISLRKKAEEEAQLASLVFYNSSEAMTIANAKNEIIAINPSFTRLTGYESEEVIGKDPAVLSSGRQDKAFYKDMWETLLATGHWEGELWNKHKDGQVFAEDLTINTIYNPDGSVDRRVAVFSDITEKKLTEEKLARQAEKLRQMVEEMAFLNIRLSKEIAVKNRLFSIIAHDLRSPFTTLSGMTKRLTDKADNYTKEVLITKIAAINRAAQSVYLVVENLLDWSRAQLEGEKMDLQDVSIRNVTEHTLEALLPMAEEKQLTLTSTVGTETVYADPDMLAMILRNLVNNAIKFSEPGGDITVSARTDADKIDISVSDQGTGIPEETFDKLFAVDEKTTTLGTSGEKGTGLGLPLCSDLAARQKGYMRLESTVGKGSTFHVLLPARADGD